MGGEWREEGRGERGGTRDGGWGERGGTRDGGWGERGGTRDGGRGVGGTAPRARKVLLELGHLPHVLIQQGLYRRAVVVLHLGNSGLECSKDTDGGEALQTGEKEGEEKDDGKSTKRGDGDKVRRERRWWRRREGERSGRRRWCSWKCRKG